jgi:ATP-dependent exoDNAse (exonuclease V) alpha subunit
MSRSIELTAKYLGERFRFDNPDGTRVIIGSAMVAGGSKSLLTESGLDPNSPITIKGEADESDLQHNATYRFFGHWNSYLNRRSGQREKQFHFRTLVPHIPHDEDGVIDYLAVAGRGNGIGPSKAKKLVQHFGLEEVLEICRTRPSDVKWVANIRTDQARSFAEKLASQKATESATLEVDKLFTGHGFPKSLVRRVIKTWGNKAAETITDDPYSLMQFRGVGFAKADKLHISLGKDPASIDRQALCLWYSMAMDAEGHTWHPAQKCVSRLQQLIGGTKVDYRGAILRGREYGQLDENHYGAIASIRSQTIDGPVTETETPGSVLWLAEGKYAAAEKYVAEAIASAMTESTAGRMTRYRSVESFESVVLKHATCHRCRQQLTAPMVHVLDGQPYGPTCIGHVDPSGTAEVHNLDDWLSLNPKVYRYVHEQPSGIIDLPDVSLWPDPSSLEIMMDGRNVISEHQRTAAANAMASRIGILTGSPGTGKTTLLASIIKAIHRTGRVGLHQIGIGAPTGKAAVRLTESLAAAGVNVRARTWHSLLGVGAGEEIDGEHVEFKHNATNPWPFRIIFGDETSMPPINIMAAIFRARAPGTHIMFVGDPNQLPPVGNGAPFRDMIAAGLPTGELREIKRNSGGIVEACAAIRDERPWTDDVAGFAKNSDSASSSNLTFTGDRTPTEQIRSMLSIIDGCRSFADPIWDIQVLTAVNKRSELSRTKLNEILQDALNPSPKVAGTPFRENDKVVCLKNGFYKSILDIAGSDDDYETTEDGEVYVANGELGRIDSIQDKTLSVRLESPLRLIQVPRGKQSQATGEGSDDKEDSSSTGCQWDLGYALSVHKFQGSEQKIIIGILDGYAGARMVCDRAWLYTLISRAREYCYLVGTTDLANRMCKVQKMDSRKTFLANRIHLASFEKEMVGL